MFQSNLTEEVAFMVYKEAKVVEAGEGSVSEGRANIIDLDLMSVVPGFLGEVRS